MTELAQKECESKSPIKCTLRPEYKILASKGGSELNVCSQDVREAVLSLINITGKEVVVSKIK